MICIKTDSVKQARRHGGAFRVCAPSPNSLLVPSPSKNYAPQARIVTQKKVTGSGITKSGDPRAEFCGVTLHNV